MGRTLDVFSQIEESSWREIHIFSSAFLNQRVTDILYKICRKIVMNDKTYVALVGENSEWSANSDHRVNFFAFVIILHLFSFRRFFIEPERIEVNSEDNPVHKISNHLQFSCETILAMNGCWLGFVHDTNWILDFDLGLDFNPKFNSNYTIMVTPRTHTHLIVPIDDYVFSSHQWVRLCNFQHFIRWNFASITSYIDWQ